MLRIIQITLVVSCLFVRSCPSINADTSHTKKLSEDNLYSSTFIYCKNINYLLVSLSVFLISISSL